MYLVFEAFLWKSSSDRNKGILCFVTCSFIPSLFFFFRSFQDYFHYIYTTIYTVFGLWLVFCDTGKKLLLENKDKIYNQSNVILMSYIACNHVVFSNNPDAVTVKDYF